jgi:hypothetical protein
LLAPVSSPRAYPGSRVLHTIPLRSWHVTEEDLDEPSSVSAAGPSNVFCMQSRGPILWPRIWFIGSIWTPGPSPCPTARFCQSRLVRRPLQHSHMLVAAWRRSAGAFARGSGKMIPFVTYFWGSTSCQATRQTNRGAPVRDRLTDSYLRSCFEEQLPSPLCSVVQHPLSFG